MLKLDAQDAQIASFLHSYTTKGIAFFMVLENPYVN